MAGEAREGLPAAYRRRMNLRKKKLEPWIGNELKKLSGEHISMKKGITIILLITLLSVLTLTAFALDYWDPDSGASFTVPDGWVEVPLSDTDSETTRFKFMSVSGQAFFIYGSADYLDTLSEKERADAKRSDYTYSSDEDILEVAEMFGADPSDVTLVNGFYVFPVNRSSDLSVKDVIMCYRFENAIAYMFVFTGDRTGTEYQEFESICQSFLPGQIKDDAADHPVPSQDSNSAPSQGSDDSSYYDVPRLPVRPGTQIAISALITFAVIVLPIIIYRYAIRKSPVSPKAARRTAVIYGIVVLAGFFLLAKPGRVKAAAAVPIVIWGLVDYGILSKGYRRPVEPAAETEPVTETEEIKETHEDVAAADITAQGVRFCRNCGSRLHEGSAFCSRCGSPVPRSVFCRSCGEKLPEDAAFCHRCGTAVPKDSLGTDE